MTDDEGSSPKPLRAALFVDFDNTFINLQKLDPKAAEAFASSPSRWLEWLERGLDSGTPRRFLIRNVYLNPASFGDYRAVYTRTGFRAVDCPALTSQSKNSADIYMVLDIMDALQSGQDYDEFIIASADADFTPVLHRLRARDRRTTLLLAGQSAAAYRAVCDSFIAPEVLADVALGQEPNASQEPMQEGAPSLLVQPTEQARSAARGAADERPERDVKAVTKAIQAAVAAADRPIVSAAAAQAALKVDPQLKQTDWWGAGSFRAFLALYVDGLTYEGSPSPGYVFDPRRHSRDDLPAVERPTLNDFEQRISVVSGAPRLTSAAYAALFTAMATDLAGSPYVRPETAKRVRDLTDLAGQSVGRGSVDFVLQGLIYSGVDLTGSPTARSLADGWIANVRSLCVNAGMALTPSDEDAVRAWIGGKLPRR